MLVVKIKPLNSSILVDCGQIGHIAKRILKSVEAVFVTHAHMDHFIGMDSFIRSVLVSDRSIRIYGPESIARKLHSKISAYNWNLVEEYFCDFDIFEISEHTIKHFCLKGSERFTLSQKETTERKSCTIYENDHYSAEAAVCDHKIPVLIYKFTEKPSFQVDENKIYSEGFKTGPWLTQLKEWFYNRQPSDQLSFNVETDDSSILSFDNPKLLYELIQKDCECLSIGYVTDVGFTESNIDTIINLMKKSTLFVCECTFLKSHQQKARESYHLCTDDLNSLISQIRPDYLLPMHLSKTYLESSTSLFEELVLPSDSVLIKLPERIKNDPLLPRDVELDF